MSDFNLKAVLRQTGLTPETLRAWERRYEAVKPKRTATGRRIYTSAEVHRVGLLSTLVRRGFRIGDIANLRDAELMGKLEQTKELSGPGASKHMDRGVAEVIHALDNFDLNDLKRKIASARYRMSPREFALEMVPAVMYRVGTLIDEGKSSIAEEHALSQFVQNELKSIYNSLEPIDSAYSPKTRFVFVTREGDHHEIGIMLAAIICRVSGVQCQYLGVNFPAASLLKVAKALKPQAIVLGLSQLPLTDEKVSPKDYLIQLDKGLPPATEIWAGGSGLTSMKAVKSKRQAWYFESLSELERKMSFFAKA